MNVEQAKTIPISEILEKIGLQPVREDSSNAYYRSPWRDERTASFHLNKQKNQWYDHGEGSGGDIIDFTRRYLGGQGFDNTVSDSLRYLKNVTGSGFPPIPDFGLADFSKEDSKLVKKSVSKIKNIGLIKYLESRGIYREIAEKHLKEVWFLNKNTGKTFCALGFRNEKYGYELRNPFFKGCLGKKSITFIRGKIPKPPNIHLFEGVMDYLTFLQTPAGKEHNDDVIVLNSLSCLREGMAYIKDYGYRVVHTWFDNDDAGDKATRLMAEFCKMEENLRHTPVNKLYKGHKDVNAWHMDNLGYPIAKVPHAPV
ncbi:toprim domain-containing protein [Mucilaginibacter sp. BJC16-A38]|uniref:toprim domain-containing protein n=1 Tax=Mucilaginibacter phenanthrenivorans TaxID=1234842 RepID=UPI002156F79F|nr:toprim domain-containing protein [Mucilaginibacter phenanthrenivorans]MCR8561050.1 toprim domain-containing protein [Mucilaginibacter phenanthrenivorans]